MSPASQIHAKITGPIVMIGFGSIGKGTLPLIERHFAYDKSRFVIIDPHEDGKALARSTACASSSRAITKDNYREVLVPLLTEGGGQGFCVNLSVDTSSVDIMSCAGKSARSTSTPSSSPGSASISTRSRPRKSARTTRCARRCWRPSKARPAGSTTAVSSCGANPGMVSLFVKQALLDIAARLKLNAPKPKSRRAAMGWGLLRTSSASRASTSPSATPSAPRSRKADERVRQHLVGGRLRVGRHAAGRTRLGHP